MQLSKTKRHINQQDFKIIDLRFDKSEYFMVNRVSETQLQVSEYSNLINLRSEELMVNSTACRIEARCSYPARFIQAWKKYHVFPFNSYSYIVK